MHQPKAPDPYKTAEAQGGQNMQAAQANTVMGNANEYTPYGSKEYTQSGWQTITGANGKPMQVPKYSSTVTLSPEQQALYQKQTQMQSNLGDLGVSQSSRLQGLLGSNMDTSGLVDWRNYSEAPDLSMNFRQDQTPTDREAVAKAMMGRFDVDSAKTNAAQEAQLAARGLSPGGQGWSDVKGGQDRQRTDALQQAFLGAGAELRAAQGAYNEVEGLKNATTQKGWQNRNDLATMINNMRQGQFSEKQALRNQPLNEISALMSGSQVSTPSFQPFSGSSQQPVNISQMIYDKYNSDKESANAGMSGMFGLGSSIAGAMPWAAWLSDRRLKYDLAPLPDAKVAGVQMYTFRYRKHPVVPEEMWGQVKVGVMADEVEKVYPQAVSHGPDGYARVNYAMLARIGG